MPILTRPVREQLEHDRVIRLLQAKYKRKTDVIINPGSEQNQSVTVGELAVFPDVLVFAEGSKRLLTTVEVETGESVNQLEALAEWNVFSKLKVPLHLYVPPSSVDAARRLCAEHQIPVAEVWTFHANFDQVRFTLIHRSPDAPIPKVRVADAKPGAAKPKAVTTLRQAQGRPDLSTGSRSPRAESKGEQGRGTKAKPAPALRQAQGRRDLSTGSRSPQAKSRGEQSRGTKAAAKAKPASKKAAPAKKPVKQPAAKKPAAKKPAKPAKKTAGKKRR